MIFPRARLSTGSISSRFAVFAARSGGSRGAGAAALALVLLGAASGCASEETSIGDANITAAERAALPTIDELLAEGGVTADNLESLRGPEGLLIAADAGALPRIEIVPAGQTQSEGYRQLKSALEEAIGIGGTHATAPHLYQYSCDADAYQNAAGQPVPASLFVVSYTPGTFRDISQMIKSIGEARGENPSQRVEAARAIEKKVTHALFLPSLHLRVFVGLGDGPTGKAWRVYAANVITPCSA